jgi:peptidoglycan hydrolase-like protein with peptidoglycan-binding domain
VMSGTAIAARQRNYTPIEMRSVLRGLGYKVAVVNGPLTDAATKKAIRDFQKHYDLGADGIAGPRTQDYAATIMGILQANLNLVVKPNPLLTRNQFYGPQTEAAVKLYQQKSQLSQTGVADLALRQKLDKEAEQLVSQPAAKPTRSTKPRSTPEATPSPTATPDATPSPTATPETTPSPTSTPTTTPTPSSTPTSKPSATPKKGAAR